jgi:hypothetical protein
MHRSKQYLSLDHLVGGETFPERSNEFATSASEVTRR